MLRSLLFCKLRAIKIKNAKKQGSVAQIFARKSGNGVGAKSYRDLSEMRKSLQNMTRGECSLHSDFRPYREVGGWGGRLLHFSSPPLPKGLFPILEECRNRE